MLLADAMLKHALLPGALALGLSINSARAEIPSPQTMPTPEQPAQAPREEEPAAEQASKGRPQFGEVIEVQGHYLNRVGTSAAASAGSYTRELIEDRPILRPGEVEELVPGVIVTQHSGAGKANQYFLRGFNLDHGTDFATTIEGIPVNLPSNAHGQGYDDLNFVIPELISHVDYVKGPYDASKGDFASAGAADIFYLKELPRAFLQTTVGEYGYYRSLGAGSAPLGGGKLLLGLEAMYEDGPWVKPEGFRKFNGILSWTRPLGDGTLRLLAMGYSGDWNATNQIPLPAVTAGLISRFGSEDTSDGGSSHRYSLSASWDGEVGAGSLTANAYVVRYDLDLFSNFTFFLTDPVNGDQLEQQERRWFFGTNGSWTWRGAAAGLDEKVRVGWDARRDHIDPLALYHTVERQRLQAYDVSDVSETSGALWGEADTRLTSWLRVVLGLRGQLYGFDVTSSDPRNSGSTTAGLLLPKASAVFGPWAQTELYANYGEGFHSNDARGVEATVDAISGEPIQRVTPLPRSRGYEVGVRTEVVPGVQSSLALWLLDLDSELVFDADAGTNEPAGPTRRKGVEWSTRWVPTRWLLFDLDVCYSQARFRDTEADGQYVPEAIEWAVAGGASIHRLGPWSASLFLRYFGPRALTQDDSVRSSASTLLNGQVAYQLTRDVALTVDVFNILDAQVDDIAYYYESQPRGLPAGNYIHFHPAEPRSVRGTLTIRI